MRIRPHADLWLPSGHRWQSRSAGRRRRGARGRDRTLRLPVIRSRPRTVLLDRIRGLTGDEVLYLSRRARTARLHGPRANANRYAEPKFRCYALCRSMPCGTVSPPKAPSMSASNNASEKCERPNGRGDRLMRSSVYTKRSPEHPRRGAISQASIRTGLAATIYDVPPDRRGNGAWARRRPKPRYRLGPKPNDRFLDRGQARRLALLL